MRCAILSDIHANLEALETVISHAKALQVDRWVVLGDSIGYGANPNECLDWVFEHADQRVTGNHEAAVVDPQIRSWFNPAARASSKWTEKTLSERLKAKILDIPWVAAEGDAVFVHGSLDEPEAFHYLFTFDDAAGTFRKMQTAVCFVGHTHLPGCICEGERTAKLLPPGLLALKEGERYILNPGSVGQPRDADPRSAYGIYDSMQRTFEIFRLPYDNIKTADKIRKAGLPRSLADRLL